MGILKVYLKYNENQLKHAMVNYSNKENHELIGASGYPMVAEGRETGLTTKEKKAVKEIMRRNDKVLRILAEM